MLPLASTATVMFSGLVCVGMLTAFGSFTGTCLLITGMVIRKMMRSTSITSTSGVVLMVELSSRSSSSEAPNATFIAMAATSALSLQIDGALGYLRTAAAVAVAGAPGVRGGALMS